MGSELLFHVMQYMVIIIVILGKKLPDENFRCAIEGLPGEVGETVRDFEGSFFSRMQNRRHSYRECAYESLTSYRTKYRSI